jgi:hypothetical protein
MKGKTVKLKLWTKSKTKTLQPFSAKRTKGSKDSTCETSGDTTANTIEVAAPNIWSMCWMRLL